MYALHTHAPRLLAGFGTAALVAAVGLFASSRPAHTAGGPIPVIIANAPLAVVSRDADNAARQPFQASGEFTSNEQATKGKLFTKQTTVTFTVPAGKELVIQGISVGAYSYASADTPLASLTTQAGGVTATHALNYFTKGPDSGTTAEFVLPEQPLTLYADAETTVTVELTGISEDFNPKLRQKNVHFPTAVLTGYLVDTP